MSQKDLQFIERALEHPWIFYVYFWKWPRIVRQACAEYDLLSKERDAAKDAHEQALRANRIVQDWIYTTHKLDMTADLRAIWTAGKRLGVLLLFLAVALPLNAQLPPILRQQWTTNANPIALKVISTNGVQAATNVWELDFTNTASVTVGVVSNANKVMVSFTGGSSGIATNAGTGWLTTFVTQTNHNQIVFTNGSKIGATAINTLTLTNAHLLFSADNTFDIGASGANRPRSIFLGANVTAAGAIAGLSLGAASAIISGNVTGGDFFCGVAASYGFANTSGTGIRFPSDGVGTLHNNALTDFTRLQFGGTTAPFPALGKTTGEGHLRVLDGTGANSTNSLIFGNTVDTTASTGMTMNRQTGRVRLASGSQTYLVTNNLATANSIVTATVNSDDANALSVKAIPAAGLITLKVNAATAANTDISFFISAP